MEQDKIINFQPQKGYQLSALSSSADIVIGGGAAGVGKTFTLLYEYLRNKDVNNFGAVIFRRTSPQIRAQGGLWDASTELYSYVLDAEPKQTTLEWNFGDTSKLKFSHLEYEKNIYDWQGSEIPFIGFDELTHFSQKMFFYMLTRNRSTCGVKPYIRATCNPDPDSWVSELIEWWIGEDGFPIPEREGVLRYFAKDGDTFIWGDTEQECVDKAWYFLKPLVERSNIDPKHFVKSLTFIGGDIYDNKALLDTNPDYLANLASQDEQTRLQLLEGNWKVALNPQDVYPYLAFKDFFTNKWVPTGLKCISVDVAMSGADKLIIMYFDGKRLEDIAVIPKSSGKDVLDQIQLMQNKYSVPNSKVTYDANGVGAFIGGQDNAFIPGSEAFFNNGRMNFQANDPRKFKNLKAQCYFLDGEDEEQYISEKVANTMYDNKMTVRQRFLFERKAIKKKALIDEEPLQTIKKDEMKEKWLSGDSPDLMDAYMQKRLFYLDRYESLDVDWN